MSLLSQASLVVTPNAYKEGKLYSVIPSDGSGDMSVVRATTATRVNSSGLVELVPYNIAQYSEQFDNAAWVKERITITANITTAPNGSLTADKIVEDNTTNSHRARQNAISEQGVQYTLSFYLKASERTKARITAGGLNAFANFDLSNGTIIGSPTLCTASIISADNGWYRCSITYTQTSATSSAQLHLAATLNAAGDFSYLGDGVSGIFIWGAQLVEGSVAKDYQKTETRLNIPRLDYSNGTCPSLLVEPQRTNTILNSVLSGTTSLPTSWNFSTSTGTSAPTPSIYSQIGQAYSFTTAATRQAIFQNQSYTSGSTYSFSVFVESVTGSIRVDNVIFQTVAGTQTFYKDGVLINASDFIESGHRYTTLMVASSTTTAQVRIGNGTGGPTTATVVLSMPQLELGSYPTSYIPTTSASVTRNADVISKTGISSLIGQTLGTVFADFTYNGAANTGIFETIFSVATNVSNEISIIKKNTTSELYVFVRNGGVIQINSGGISGTNIIGTHKVALAYKLNDYALYLDGVQVYTNTSATVPTCSGVFVGQAVNLLQQLGGGIKAAALWKTRLTNDELERLTGTGFNTYAEMANYYNYITQ